MGEVVGLPDQVFRQIIALPFGDRGRDAKGAPDGGNGIQGRHFVQRDSDPGGADATQVQTLFDGGFHNRALKGADIHGDGIKDLFRKDIKARAAQPLGHGDGARVDALRDGLQPGGAMKDRVHRSHDRQ